MQGRSTCSFRAGKVAALHGPLTSDKVVGSLSSLLYSQHKPWADLRIKSRYMYDKTFSILVHVHVGTCMGWFF